MCKLPHGWRRSCSLVVSNTNKKWDMYSFGDASVVPICPFSLALSVKFSPFFLFYIFLICPSFCSFPSLQLSLSLSLSLSFYFAYDYTTYENFQIINVVYVFLPWVLRGWGLILIFLRIKWQRGGKHMAVIVVKNKNVVCKMRPKRMLIFVKRYQSGCVKEKMHIVKKIKKNKN